MMADHFKILCLKGQKIIPFIPELAKLRIHVFKAYPYLYDGDLDYEYNYLQIYVECSESIIVLALHHDKIIGASSAIPLKFETMEVQKPFLEHQININDIFYLGESVLQSKYRGRGIYKHFFTQREAAAREYGCKITTFAVVERAFDDARKPKDYIPLDEAWIQFGYEKHLELRTCFKWKEIGEEIQTPKTLVFWLKKL